MPMGSAEHNIDPKGRLFIPAKLRSGLGESFVVSRSMDIRPCLCIYTAEEFDELIAKIKQSHSLVESNYLLEIIYKVSTQPGCDAQGRITLNQPQRKYADLKDTAYIIGIDRHIEIWNIEKWELESAEDDQDKILRLFSEVR